MTDIELPTGVGAVIHATFDDLKKVLWVREEDGVWRTKHTRSGSDMFTGTIVSAEGAQRFTDVEVLSEGWIAPTPEPRLPHAVVLGAVDEYMASRVLITTPNGEWGWRWVFSDGSLGDWSDIGQPAKVLFPGDNRLPTEMQSRILARYADDVAVDEYILTSSGWCRKGAVSPVQSPELLTVVEVL